MNANTNQNKAILIIGLAALITVMHYASIRQHPGYHFLHRELFFIPILLTCFWFGLRYGLLSALAISSLYAPHAFYYSGPHDPWVTVISQVLMFNLVAVVLGWLVDRQKKEHAEAVTVENLAVLGRAAGAVGDEMKYLLGSLKKLVIQAKEEGNSELSRSFKKETERMEHIVDVLTSFISEEREDLLSCDINETIRKEVERHVPIFEKAGITLGVTTDEAGCPTVVNPAQIERVLKSLIQNAVEISSPGKNIYIRSYRKGEDCIVEVKDEGPGIRPEHLPKIFTPFFTTKKNGQGLALAGCRKTLRDMGGDIRVDSQLGDGATFTLIIPRDYSDKSVVNNPISSVMQGKPVGRLYRD